LLLNRMKRRLELPVSASDTFRISDWVGQQLTV
jgi:hypothetical protein